MITVNDKIYRNLEEQVLQNHEDILYLMTEGGTLNEFGIKVVGQVNSVSQLPNPSTYTGEYGDAYAVGTSTPYTFYIFTRQTSGTTDNYWFNIGQFPVPSTVPGPVGPQGPQGEQGIPGKDGKDGKDGSQGIQGPQGPVGPIGPQGIQGIPGAKGENGRSFAIRGTLANINQLPTPTAQNQNEAYLIGTAQPYDLYVVVGPENGQYSWLNVGRVEGVEGPQGPIGPIGPIGPQGEQGIQGETGPEGPKGDQGIPGEVGPIGPQGPKGIQGIQGPQGVSITDIMVSNPVTLPNGTQYTISYRLSNGPNYISAGTFVAPQGIIGPVGPAGVVDYDVVNEYVDEKVADYLPLAGGNMTGPLVLPSTGGITNPDLISGNIRVYGGDSILIQKDGKSTSITEGFVSISEDNDNTLYYPGRIYNNENTIYFPNKAGTFATTDDITDAIAGITQFKYQVVDTLPTTGEAGIIYLVPHNHGESDTYDEYVWVDGKFELLGNKDIDLSDYATNESVSNQISEVNQSMDSMNTTLSNQISNIRNDYLPLTGGTITGSIKFPTLNTYTTSLTQTGLDIQATDTNRAYFDSRGMHFKYSGTSGDVQSHESKGLEFVSKDRDGIRYFYLPTTKSSLIDPTINKADEQIATVADITTMINDMEIDASIAEKLVPYATKEYVNNAISEITGFDFQVVDILPETGVKGTIYLVAHNHGESDGYDEYIWVGTTFEKIGSTDIDLSQYSTKEELANAVATINSNVDKVKESVETNATNILDLQQTKANQSELANYLPLTGGVIEGNLRISSRVNDDSINVFELDCTRPTIYSWWGGRVQKKYEFSPDSPTRGNNSVATLSDIRPSEVVTALPETPDANTLYYIVEE